MSQMRSGESEYLPESYICESNVRQPVLHTSLLSFYNSAATQLNAPSCRPVTTDGVTESNREHRVKLRLQEVK
jgi:hypothetical protein